MDGEDNALDYGILVTPDMRQEVKSNLQSMLNLETFCASDTLSGQDRLRAQQEINGWIGNIDGVGENSGIEEWSSKYGVSDLSVATPAAAEDAVTRTNAALKMINEEIGEF